MKVIAVYKKLISGNKDKIRGHFGMNVYKTGSMYTFQKRCLQTYFTFFKLGFAFFAAFEAPRVLAAKIALAESLENPSFLAIADAAALNPIPFLTTI
jgi:hypothetical protein